jgi:hypothetical protein
MANGVLSWQQQVQLEECGHMSSSHVDIFKKDVRGNPVWIDAVTDLESAQLLITRWASTIPGEYFAFDQRRHQIVASLVRLESDSSKP